ncbi:MAG: hypothetical protein NTZ06_04405 [Actinobacteria bacterium]|nr:hypothetical protein [Actinomycetota bacterium]
MKRILLVVLMVFISIPLEIMPAHANVEGCPDTWTIDTSKYPNNIELSAAKEKLGPNMVLSVVSTKILEFKGEDGIQPALDSRWNIVGSNRLKFYYLYGLSKAETIVKIEVKGCPNPSILKFNHDFFDSAYSGVSKTTAKEWAARSIESFTDFKKQESFSDDLQALNQKAQDYLDKYLQRGDFTKPLWTIQLFGNEFDVFRNLKRVIILQTMTPNCLVPSKQQNFLELATGKRCQFAWSVGERISSNDPKDNRQQLVLFEPFYLDATLKSPITISCIKGKIAKKVSAVNPKCPAGYKKK